MPLGWIETSLNEICVKITKGSTPTSYGYKYQSSGVNFVKVESIDEQGNISNISAYIDSTTNDFLKRSILEKDDILFSIAGTIGRIAIVKQENLPANTNQALAIIRLAGGVNKKFIFYLLKTSFIKDQSSQAVIGVARANLSLTDISNFTIPLPPLGEQKRIVAKLDAVMEKVEASRERLERIPEILKQFRQSVLAAAVSGRLTADWRKKNPDVERWEFLTLSEVASRIQIGPFGTQLHKQDYITNGIPLINPSHIKHSKIVPDINLSISEEKYTELSNYVLKKGDTILGRRGEMGRCALVTDTEDGWLCGTGSLFVRPSGRIHSRFLATILGGNEVKQYLEKFANGSTMANLNLKILKGVPIPLPSLEEQTVIFEKADSLFSIADQIEARYEAAKAQLDQLPQAILAKVFRGELVPQNPNDEPASVLLERIQTEKSGKGKTAKSVTQPELFA